MVLVNLMIVSWPNLFKIFLVLWIAVCELRKAVQYLGCEAEGTQIHFLTPRSFEGVTFYAA